MKNVAFIIPNLKGGGAERVVSNLSKKFPKTKYNVYLVVFDSSEMKYDFGGILIDLNIKPGRNIFKKTLNFIGRYKKILKFKKTYNIDTAISFLPGPNFLNVLTKKREKTILSIRANIQRDNDTIYTKIDKVALKMIYKKSDYIAVVSKGIKNDLINNFKIDEEKVKVIYNSYKIDEIYRLSNELISIEEEKWFNHPVAISVGRLTNSKGFAHLIRAFKNVKLHKPETKLIILGEGEQRGYLEKLILELGLENEVYMPGFVKNPYKYIRNSNLFISLSLSEGFPNALAEAMICEIPIISSDCKTGPREILAPKSSIDITCEEIEFAESGILIPVCDGHKYNSDDLLTKEELTSAKAMIKILNDDILSKNYATAAKERVKDFDIRESIKEWENIV